MKMGINSNTPPIAGGAILPKAMSFSSGGNPGGAVSIIFSSVNFNNGVQAAPIVIASLAEADLATVNMNFNGNKRALITGTVAVDFSPATIGGVVLKLYVDGVLVSQATKSVEKPSVTNLETMVWNYVLPVTPVGVKVVKVAVLNGGPANLTADLGLVTVMEFL